MTENLFDAFLIAFETYDQHEDMLMKLFSSSLIGKAKQWYNSISPRAITNWDIFRNLFIKMFTQKKVCISLYDQICQCKRTPRESIYSFNDQFNTLVKRFP